MSCMHVSVEFVCSQIDLRVIVNSYLQSSDTDRWRRWRSNKTELQRLMPVLCTEQHSYIRSCSMDALVVMMKWTQLRWYVREFTGIHEERADDRLMLRCAWQVTRRNTQLVVISNDVDTVVRSLRFIPECREHCLLELWWRLTPATIEDTCHDTFLLR